MTDPRRSRDPGRTSSDNRWMYRYWVPIFGVIAVLQGVAAITAFVRGSLAAGLVFTSGILIVLEPIYRC